MKIIRKPCPVGNEFKNVANGKTNIVLKLEVYEGRELMAAKEHVKEHGATTACVLRLVNDWAGTGSIIIGDSWFGSVKSSVDLKKIGLYSNMIVKTAHKKYPMTLLKSKKLVRG